MADGYLPRSSNSTLAEKKVNSRPPESSERHSSAQSSGTVREIAQRTFGGCRVGDESERARLISEISRVLRDPTMPETTRTAGLTLIGWLARRMPGETAHAIGVPEARESERRLKAARQKLR